MADQDLAQIIPLDFNPERAAAEFWNNQPSPHDPTGQLTNAEFPQAVKLATKLKFGGHALAAEAAGFWSQFKDMNTRLVGQKKEPLSPEEFGHAVDKLAPVAFAFHGRPPTMNEISTLHDRPPSEARRYFYDLPDQQYPHVPAGEMVRHVEAAKPWAQQHLQRDPVKNEAAYLYHSGQNPQDYYQALGQDKQQKEQTGAETGGNQATAGTDSGGRRPADAGGSPTGE